MIDTQLHIILEDDVVKLRPLERNDYNNLSKIAFEETNLLQYFSKPIYNKTLLEDFIETALASRAKQERYPFAIINKNNNQLIGSTSFLNISNYDKRLEIGFTWLGKKFHQTGINKRCKYLLLDYCFNTLNFERIEFKTDERNVQSRNAIQSLGATQEGILRSHMLMYDGVRRNTVYYSILKEEFENSKIYSWYNTNNR